MVVEKEFIMKRKKTVHLGGILFAVNLFVAFLPGAEGRIGFEQIGHLIIVKGAINQSEKLYNFVVDTGGIAAIDKELAGELGLKQQGLMAKIDRLNLSGFEIENIFCSTAFNFKHFHAEGIPIHGMIGSNLLERFAVTFNFKSRTLVLSDQETSLAYNRQGIFLKFFNHPVNNAPCIYVKLGSKDTQAMVDTGQPYPLVIPLKDYYAYRDVLEDPAIKSTGLMIKWPGAAANYNYIVRLKTVEIDKLSIKHGLCVFGEIPAMLSMPLLGMDFLKQFELMINYPKDELLLIPNPDLKIPNNIFTAGFSATVNRANQVVIEGIWTGSAAEKAQLRPGDQILRANFEPVSGVTIIKLRQLLLDDSIENIHLKIKNETGDREVTLAKEKLFK